MRTRRTSKEPPASALLEIAEEADAETASEPDISPPTHKRVKTSPKSRRKSRSRKKKGPLTLLLEKTLERNDAIAAALQDRSPSEHDVRVDVVVQEIRRMGHLANLRCGILNQEQRVEQNILIDVHKLEKQFAIEVGRSLTICAPWHVLNLPDGMTTWICPFVLPRRT